MPHHRVPPSERQHAADLFHKLIDDHETVSTIYELWAHLTMYLLPIHPLDELHKALEEISDPNDTQAAETFERSLFNFDDDDTD